MNEQIEQLQMAIDQRNMPLKLYTGQEVRLAGNILELYEKTITYISTFQLFAVGTPSNHIPKYTKDIIYSLLTAGITPIIAHPERNRVITENPSHLEQIIREGTCTNYSRKFSRIVWKSHPKAFNKICALESCPYIWFGCA